MVVKIPFTDTHRNMETTDKLIIQTAMISIRGTGSIPNHEQLQLVEFTKDEQHRIHLL